MCANFSIQTCGRHFLCFYVVLYTQYGKRYTHRIINKNRFVEYFRFCYRLVSFSFRFRILFFVSICLPAFFLLKKKLCTNWFSFMTLSNHKNSLITYQSTEFIKINSHFIFDDSVYSEEDNKK